MSSPEEASKETRVNRSGQSTPRGFKRTRYRRDIDFPSDHVHLINFSRTRPIGRRSRRDRVTLRNVRHMDRRHERRLDDSSSIVPLPGPTPGLSHLPLSPAISLHLYQFSAPLRETRHGSETLGFWNSPSNPNRRGLPHAQYRSFPWRAPTISRAYHIQA